MHVIFTIFWSAIIIRNFAIFSFERTYCQPRRHWRSHFIHAKALQQSDNLP